MTPGESVQFADGVGTKSNVVTESGGTTVVKYDVQTSTLTAGSDGKVQAGSAGTAFATAGDVATAINNSGWNLQANGDTASLVKPGDTVQFSHGNNIHIERTGNNITIETTRDVTFESVTTNVLSVNPGGTVYMGDNKVTSVGDGDISADSKDAINGSQLYQVQQQATAAKTEVKAGTNVASVTSEKGDKGQTIYTVNADGATVSEGSDAVKVVGTKGADNVTDYKVDLSDKTKASLDKADTAMQSLTTSVNGQQVELLNQNNKDINFVNGTGTTARASGSDITFDVNTDGTTIKVDSTGNLTAVTATLSHTDGKVDAPVTADAGKLVTAQSVADAINNSGWTLTANGADGGLVKPGATVDLNNTDGNIVISKSGNNVTYNLAKDIKVDSVTATNNVSIVGGPSMSTTGIDAAGKKITHVAAGDVTPDSKDAINGSQLYQVQQQAAAAKTEVTGDQGVTVTSSTNTTSGGTIYNVAAKTDGTTITVDSTGNLTAVTTALTNSNTGKVNTPTHGDALVNAKTVADAINNSGWNLQANGDTASLVKPGDTVQFLHGNNIHIERTGNNITIETTRDVTFESVTTNVLSVNPGGTVYMGDNKVANVGDGDISADSKDAINGSQLYQVQQQATAAKTEVKAGTNVASVTSEKGDKGQTIYTVNADGATVSEGSDAVKVVGTKGADNVTDYKVDLSDKTKASLDKADTAMQSLTTSVNGQQVELLNQNNKDINFVNGTGTTARASGSDITFDVNTDGTTIKVDSTGNLTAVTSGITTAPNGTSTATTPTSLVTAGDVATAINNSGWNLQANGDTASLVKPGNTVQFLNGQNIDITREGNNITVATAKDVTFNSVTTGNLTVKAGSTVDMGGNKITNVAAGDVTPDSKDAINGSQLYQVQQQAAAAKTEVTGDQGVTVTSSTNATSGGTIYNVAAKTDGGTLEVNAAGQITAKTGEVTSSGTAADLAQPTYTAAAPNALVTGSTLASVANSLVGEGLNFVGNDGANIHRDLGTQLSIKGEHAADAVSAKNVYVKGDAATNTLLVQIAENPVFTSVQLGGDTGPKISADGNNIQVGDKDGAATKITNVAAGDVTPDSKDAINGSQLYQVQQQAAAAKTEVTGDQGVTVTSSTNATSGGTIYNVAAKTDGTTIKVDSTGNLTAVTATLSHTDGKVDAPVTADAGKLVTAQSVADAINNSGWTLTANGADGGLVKPGATVDLNNTDGNIVISKSGNNVTYNLAKDIKVDSVTATNNVSIVGGPSMSTTGIDAAGKKITHVAAGDVTPDSKDAINGSQLYQVQQQAAAAKTEVTGDQGVTVTSSTNTTSGGTIYNVAAKTDGTTITVDSTGNLTAVTTALTNSNTGKVNTPTHGDALVNAKTVADAINNSGWNLQANGDTASLVKPGDTVQFLNGQNIDITREGNNITVATAKDVTFNSVTTGNLTVKAGSTVDMGGNKITNVAAGDVTPDSKDAINGSQLYQVQQQAAAAKTEVTGDQGMTVTSSTNATSGGTIYNVAAKTDGTTITVDSTGNLTAVTSGITSAPNGTSTATTPTSLVTAGEVATAINNSGWTLTANGADGGLVKPGAAVDLNNTDGNIVISKSGNNVTHNLAKDLKGLSSAEFKDGEGNTTTVSGSGVSVTPAVGVGAGNPVTLTGEGLNNGGNRITNVAPGIADTDAVNVNQLKAVGANLSQQIEDNKRKAYGAAAGATAQANLPQVMDPGAKMLAAAVGTVGGQSALAVGMSARSDNGKWVVKGSLSANTQSQVSAGVGVGYTWR